MVCAPVGFLEPDPRLRSNSAQTSAPSGNDPATWIAAWIAKNLKPHQSEDVANTDLNAQAAHPLLLQIIQKALDLARIIYAETCRQLSVHPSAGTSPRLMAVSLAGSGARRRLNLFGTFC